MPAETEATEDKVQPPRFSRRQRIAIWLGSGAAAIAVLFVLLVFVLPTPVARYVIESQLEDLGIEHSGIDTVEIDLWNSQVRAGPVAFRSSGADEGQIGATGFDYSFGELFESRAFVQTFYLRGVDVYITRRDDGAIEINGIDLQRRAASREAAGAAASDAEEKGSGFGFGGDTFEFTDSRLVFRDVSGGTLTLDLHRLTLDRLRSWTPDEPTSFAFEGRLNETEIALNGTVVPLGNPLIVTLNSHVEGLTLDRLARFIGPTGLARQEGAAETDVHYDYAIYRDGRIRGTVDGTYTFAGLDVATTEGATVQLDEAVLKVDLHQEIRPDGSATATGQLRLAGGRLALATAEGDAIELDSLELGIEDLNLRKAAEPRERYFAAAPAAGAGAEAIPSIVELLIGWARRLGEDALNHRLSIDGKPGVTLKAGRLRLAARDGQPGQELRVDQVDIDLGEVASEAFDAGWSARGALDTVVTGLKLALQDGSAEAALPEIRVGARGIAFEATLAEVALDFDLVVELRSLAARQGQDGALSFDHLVLATERFTIAQTDDSEEAAGPVTLDIEGLSAGLPDAAGPLAVSSERLNLSLAPFRLDGKQGEAANFTGSFAADGLALARGGESPLTAAVASLRSELSEIRVAPLSAAATVTGGLTTGFSEVQFRAGQGAEGVTLGLQSVESRTEQLRISDLAHAIPSLSLTNRTSLQSISAGLTSPEGDLAVSGENLSFSLAPFRLDGKQGEAASLTGSFAVDDFALLRGGESTLAASVASLRSELSEIRVAPLGAEATVTGGLTTGLSEIQLQAGQGAEVATLALQSLENRTEQLRVSDLANAIPSISLTNRTSLQDFSAGLTRPEGDLALRGAGLDLDLTSLALGSEEEEEAARFTGSLAAQGLAFERGGEQPLSASLAETRTDFRDLRVAPLGPQAEIEGALTAVLSELRAESGSGTDLVSIALESFENQVEGLRASGLDGDRPEVSLASHTRLKALKTRLPVIGETAVEASLEALDAPLSELAIAGETLRATGGIEATGIAARTEGKAPQSLDLASLSVVGLAADSDGAAAIERIALGLLTAKLSLPLPGQAAAEAGSDEGAAAAQPPVTAAETKSDDGATAPVFDRPFRLGEFSLAPGSRIEVVDRSVQPPLQASLLLNELRFGPLDSQAPEQRTEITLALAANETSQLRLKGWAAPLKAAPDFALTSRIEGVPLPYLSPYAAVATGVNIESGALSAGVDATAEEAKLAGRIDLRIDDLFVTPLSEEEAKRLQADIGLPVGFAVSILKDSKGVIAFGLPLSGTIEAPEIDYSEAINKAVSGAMAKVFPTSWFGPDGNTFKMQPAPFEPGTAELTEEGIEIADHMGGLFASKPGISIRACGRAGRADLVAIRGGPEDMPADAVMPAGDPAAAAGPPGPPGDAAAAAPDGDAEAAAAVLTPPAEKLVAPPDDAEVEALLALATERGLAVRKYLQAKYGIEPGRIPECRTTYSIDDGKPPRAEFQF